MASIIYSFQLFLAAGIFIIAHILEQFTDDSLNNLILPLQITGKMFLAFYIGSTLQYVIVPAHYTSNFLEDLQTQSCNTKTQIYIAIIFLRIFLISFMIIGFTI